MSNKMPNDNHGKTVSGLRAKVFFYFLSLLAFALTIWGLWRFNSLYPSNGLENKTCGHYELREQLSKLGSTRQQCVLVLEKVFSEQDKALGLSGRQGLPASRGMLFVFDQPAERCMWMKDMKFSIDILWLDTDKKIVAVEKNLSPPTYPNTFCNAGSQYVLEVSAGVSDVSWLGVGKKLNF